MTPSSISSRALIVAIAVIVSAVAILPADARPPSAVIKAQDTPSLFVTVPPKVQPVTYILGDKIWTIRADRGVASTVVLPAKATHISFSAGAIITTSAPASNGGEPTTKDYTISRAVTLEKLSAEAIRENAAFIAAGALELKPLNVKEREKANEGNGPHLISPKYASAPNCSEIHRAVKKYVKDHPERVLEVVALQIGHHPSCACEVVKAAIIASEANTALVVEIVEAAIEVAPSRFRIIGQCAIAVAPDALSEVQTIVNQYGAVSGDSGFGAKGAELSEKSAKGAKGGAGGDIYDPSQIQEDQPIAYRLPDSELQDLIDLVNLLSETVVNPFTVIGDFRTDINNKIIPSSVRRRRVLFPQDLDTYRGIDNGPTLVRATESADIEDVATIAENDSGTEILNDRSNGAQGSRGLNDGVASGISSDGGQGDLDDEPESSAAFQVLGFVNQPGEENLPPSGKIDILQAIVLAGGLQEDANQTECIVMRANTPPTQAMKVNLRDIRSGEKPMVFVYEDDIVIIKKLPF